MHLGSFLQCDELLETIVHLLDGLELGQAHAAFVGDIVDTTFSFSVLSAGSAHLQVVLSGGLFQLDAVSSQFGQLDVHRGADGGAQVGGAEGQETETVVVGEGDAFLDLVDGGNQAAVDGLQVTTLLHGDDAEMIFFVAPDQESLVNVVVDTATSGPVAASVGSLEEAITFLEQEVVIDQLLLDLLGHSGERVESSLQFTFQSGERGGDFVFHLLVLGLSQAGVEGVSLHRAAATDAGRDDVLALRVQVAQSFDISEVTSGVLVASFESGVVVADDGVEQVSEDGVRLGIGGIDTNTRVQILHTGLNDIEKSGAEGSLQVLCLIEDLTGQEFLQQRFAAVGGLHLGEASFQFLLNGSINHIEIFCGPKGRNRQVNLLLVVEEASMFDER